MVETCSGLGGSRFAGKNGGQYGRRRRIAGFKRGDKGGREMNRNGLWVEKREYVGFDRHLREKSS